MSLWSNFWDLIWWFLWIFAFITYIWAVIAIISDIFRDHALKGWAKAIWLIFLIVVPFLTALVYLIARGSGMAQRNQKAVAEAQTAADDYIRTVAGASPSDEIARAKALLDAGTITEAEYKKLKAKALG